MIGIVGIRITVETIVSPRLLSIGILTLSGGLGILQGGKRIALGTRNDKLIFAWHVLIQTLGHTEVVLDVPEAANHKGAIDRREFPALVKLGVMIHDLIDAPRHHALFQSLCWENVRILVFLVDLWWATEDELLEVLEVSL